MKKINQKFFYDIIDIDKNDIRIEKKIPSISQKEIHEFKIGKNFFYEITDNDKLLTIQKKLNVFITKNIPINRKAVAFRKGYSYLNLFEPHKKNYHFLRLDIRSFFHSINIDDIKKAFIIHFQSNDAEVCIEEFLKIISYTVPKDSLNKKFRDKTILPMGFITSPAISNIIFRKLDIQIQKLCFDKDIVYTRYADDMLFSSAKEKKMVHSDNFINEIRILISQLGFKLNAKKTLKAEHTLSLNGYVIQNKTKNITSEIRISNKKTKIIKKLKYLHGNGKSPKEILKKLFKYEINQKKFSSTPTPKTLKKYYADQFRNKISGYRSYLISIIKFNNKYNCTSSGTIEKYSKLINDLNSIISKL